MSQVSLWRLNSELSQTAKSQIQGFQMPTGGNPEMVQQEAEQAAQAEMRSAAMGMMVRLRLRRLNAAVAEYGHHATWQQGLFNASVRTGRTDAQFEKARGMYNLQMGEVQGSVSGYSQFHSEAAGLFW